ncbi:hypothetical protein [Staphylococcus delphini]|nr:hypothetical protein [Staphylococcus delphini]MDE9828844.1 hypothetical protein [Staphylococcus delphini]
MSETPKHSVSGKANPFGQSYTSIVFKEKSAQVQQMHFNIIQKLP